MSELVEVEPGRWRLIKASVPPARSDLPLPYVISDTMPPIEQVDGRIYTSKSQFRAIGKAFGLTEVGTEKLKPKVRAADLPETKQKRRDVLKTALQRYKAGNRRAP